MKEVKDICIWEYASWVLGLLPTSHTEKIEFCLINALAFVQGRLGSTNKCVKCASYLEMEGTKKVDLIKRWMKDGLIGTLSHGEDMIQDLSQCLLVRKL